MRTLIQTQKKTEAANQPQTNKAFFFLQQLHLPAKIIYMSPDRGTILKVELLPAVCLSS